MSILITGSTGFLGRNLLNSLKKNYSLLAPPKKQLDLLSATSVEQYFKQNKIDTIIHCAITGGSRLKKDCLEHFVTNMTMYENLMLVKETDTTFINFDSGASENPNTYYGASKRLISENLKARGNVYNLRVFGCFGKDEPDTRFIKSTILKMLAKEDLQLDRNKFMDFFHIEDLVLVVKNILKRRYHFGYVPLDLVYRKKYTLYDIAKLLKGEVGYLRELGATPPPCSSYIGVNSEHTIYAGIFTFEVRLKQVCNEIREDFRRA